MKSPAQPMATTTEASASPMMADGLMATAARYTP